MDSRQNNKQAMYRAVNNVFNTFPQEVDTIPALKSNVLAFDDLLSKIDKMHQVQMDYSSANSKLKLKEEEEMIQATIQVAAAIYVHAHSNNMPDLKSKVSITPSDLKQMTDKELSTKCLNIYELALSLVDNLADYGVTTESVGKLKKEIDDFTALLAAPRSEIVTRSQATGELKELFAQVDDLLRNQIDKLMLMLEMSQPKVYKTFKAARIIVDLKGSKAQEEETTVEV
ncbi:hypothetical protein [Carboxylicivirga sp. M1479]|uniref:hypothetical protein n=1 Tax=Carboxylicivirga sp. M1479 TaxID=2594476 RepID=UPI001177D76B|nr:hypothetical protein [Carboxylicivirga sp. M1479]TRX71540.1 hypothetical protein FNN09_06095 [Carboxylicivirga sp. M1479]